MFTKAGLFVILCLKGGDKMNTLKNGTIAVGMPGSQARRAAEFEDAIKPTGLFPIITTRGGRFSINLFSIETRLFCGSIFHDSLGTDFDFERGISGVDRSILREALTALIK